ncbi:ATP-dependent metallopeptidase FtsH/Yme1/Tma family protein [Candidatus Woesebacteria bacterium]|nr:ATP-dependent metallopeptidase FtsH/Yme1/Tma family protein [Candidatus Woesebacteria bacterium]
MKDQKLPKIPDKKKFQVVKVKINIWTVVIVALLVIFSLPFFLSFAGFGGLEEKIDISTALNDIKNDKVERVEVQNEKVVLIYSDESQKVAIKEESDSFTDLMEKSGIDPTKVNYKVVDQSMVKAFGEILGILLPIGVMIAIFYFIMRSQARGAQDIFSFGRSRAKLFAKGKQSVTFKDVAGVDDAKKELAEVVDFLKNPGKYRKIGARTRDLFGQAKAQAPSIIFIDEIDAIGRQRGRGFIGGHDEREQTLNQILVEMDGFTPNDSVLVMAATNRGDLLDPALLRPGRFDRRVVLDLPDKEGREDILKIHAQGKKFAKGIDWGRVAERTVGFSGADLENMLNEAAILAARDNKTEIEMSDIEEAATKVKLGPAKKRLQSEEDKKITAYHEAGHAIVTHFLTKTDPVHRISIVARGMSLGHTLIPPASDRTHETKSRLAQTIVAVLGGRAAEETVFNEMTSGAANDIDQATRVARAMVADFGMSTLGPIDLGPQYDADEFGRTSWFEPANVSPAMQEKVDMEIKKIVDSAYKEAVVLVKKNRKKLDAVADALIEKETLDREEFEKIVGKKQNGK